MCHEILDLHPSLQVAMSSFRDPEAVSDEWLKSVLTLIAEAEAQQQAQPVGGASGDPSSALSELLKVRSAMGGGEKSASGDPSGALSELLKVMSVMGGGGMGGASSSASSSTGIQAMLSSMLSASGTKDLQQGANKEV